MFKHTYVSKKFTTYLVAFICASSLGLGTLSNTQAASITSGQATTVTANAATPTASSIPSVEPTVALPPVPNYGGEAVVLIDGDTGEVLTSRNPNKWMNPASTTKMVTLLTAIDKKGTQFDQLATITPYAVSMEPSIVGLRVGDQITLAGVAEAMMVASGNDAAVVLAQNVDGSIAAFSRDMNEEAKKAGAVNSVFLNPHGLTQAGHHTTAMDLAKIAVYAMKNPMFHDLVGDDYYSVPYQNRPHDTLRTTNLFIRSGYPGANGLKTGYTQAAGDCLIASATRNGHTFIAVMLNDDDRWVDAPHLLDYAFARANILDAEKARQEAQAKALKVQEEALFPHKNTKVNQKKAKQKKKNHISNEAKTTTINKNQTA